MSVVNTLKARLVELDNEMSSIRNTVETEQRLLTDEETTKLETAKSEHANLTRQLNALDGAIVAKAETAKPQARVPAMSAIRSNEKSFPTLGHFVVAVRDAKAGNTAARERLMNAATTYGSEGTDADGGYALPDDIRSDIQQSLYSNTSLLTYVKKIPTFSHVVTFPVDEVNDWSVNYSGSWLGEGSAYNEAKPSLGTLSITVAKVGTIVNVTEELMADAPAMGAFVADKVGSRLNYLINAGIISGSGAANNMTGMLLGAAKKTIAKESGQPASTLFAQNIQKMYFGMTANDRANAVWLVSDSAEPYLANLQLSGTSLYNRPGDYVNSPTTTTLMGRPVIVTPQLAAFSSEADVMFVNPQKYYAVVKGGVNSAVTPYFYWNQDIQSIKVSVRIGGKPAQLAVTTLPDTTTRSPYVLLGAR